LRVRHHDHASKTACICHKRYADAYIAGCTFDYDTAWLKLAASLGIVDHG
jgi:hypothetical protein